MPEEPYVCGTCKHFEFEDSFGIGWCHVQECNPGCTDSCPEHETEEE